MLEVIARYDKATDAWTLNFGNVGGYNWKPFKKFKETLMGLIPSSDRDYNPLTHDWMILGKYWEAPVVGIKFLIVAQGWKIKEEKEEDYENFFYNTIPEQHVETHDELHTLLVQLLGTEQITKKAYLLAAKKLHPDVGGDAAQMSELNRLWSLYNAS
jgi:hypothetical protein